MLVVHLAVLEPPKSSDSSLSLSVFRVLDGNNLFEKKIIKLVLK